MSGDLEDFLKRAAQRRQAKAAQAQQQQPAQRQPPQYSDRRTERVVRAAEPEEILTAEIVEEEDPNSFAARLRRVEEAKRAAEKVQAEVAKKIRRGKRTRSSGAAVASAVTGQPADSLVALLRRPGGMKQAILLREIFDRPEHRW